jgi:hypothetical protein
MKTFYNFKNFITFLFLFVLVATLPALSFIGLEKQNTITDCNSNLTITSSPFLSGCIKGENSGSVISFTLDSHGNTTLTGLCADTYHVCVISGGTGKITLDGIHNGSININNGNACTC